MTANDWYLNSLQLDPSSDIYITEAIGFKSSSKSDSTTSWSGTDISIRNIQPQPIKVSLKGFATTRTGWSNLMQYDSSNYNWNTDVDNVYLIEDLSRRWKVRKMSVSPTFDRNVLPFDIDLELDKISPEGYVENQATGTVTTSPTNITSLVNAGDKDTNFKSIAITGAYASGANLAYPILTQASVGYDLLVANVLLDTATFTFYDDLTAKHYYLDTLTSGTKNTRNCNSSTNVTFSTDRLQIAASGELKYKLDLAHPLMQDPILTLSIENLVSDPILQVSPDDTNWWDVEKTLVGGNQIDYNLTKLAGYSTFYWRIVTDSGDSLDITRIELESWHNYSGQGNIPYLRKNSVSETLAATMSAGNLTYDIRYRNKYNI